MVSTLPDGELHPAGERWDKFIARKMHIAYSRCLIVLSQHDKQVLENQGVRNSCFVIPHGVNSLYSKYIRSDIPETNSVLFFGGIIDRKGLGYLIKAAPLISRSIPDAKIIIAGPGDMGRYIPLLRAVPNIEVHNRFVPHEEVAPLFQRAKVVVLPYTEKVFSGVVPLAYAFGKPVVVTDMVSGFVEPGETGLIVPQRDEKALAEAIVRLLQDEELRRTMSENCLSKLKNELSWDRIAEETMHVYEESMRG